MRKIPARLAVGVLLLLLLAGGLGTLLLRPGSVPVHAVELRDVSQSLVVAGRVRPFSRAGLGSSIPGVIRQVLVEEGDGVQPGDMLVQLENAEALAGVTQARAGLAEARAALDRLRVVDRPALGAAAEQARLEAEQAERELDRAVALFQRGGSSRQNLEIAEQRFRLAELRLEAAEAEVRSHAEDGPGTAAALAGIQRARGLLEAAEARLSLTGIKADVVGTVLRRQAEPGDVVQPGRVLLEVAVDGNTELVVYPDEQNLSDLRVGQEARASADAFPREWFAAVVSRIAPAVDPQQGTVEVRLLVPDPPEYLLPEMTVSVDIRVANRDRALVLPADAIRQQGGQSWVLSVRDGRVERRHVELGVLGDRYVEVLSGLAEGDKVLVAGVDREPGTRVRTRSAGGH